jgi:predicted hotdog family 3-hydroxylacyl-ACP dehydratase
MLQKYQPTDPVVMLAIELAAQAADDWQAIREAQLHPDRGFIILDREARAKQQAARHLRDMLLSLRDLLQNPPPSAEDNL